MFILLFGQALLKSCPHVYSISVFLSVFHVIMNKVGEFIISAQLFFLALWATKLRPEMLTKNVNIDVWQ